MPFIPPVTMSVNPFGQMSAMQTLQPSARTEFVDGVQKGSFKDTMSQLIQDTDKTLSEPDALMNRAVTTGDVDIHQVMIANTKADIAVNIASQVVTKIVQAYDRIQQIQM